MATVLNAPGLAPAESDARERRFFLYMAIAITGIVLAGFGGYILVGISSFDAPWWVHLHAVSYMSWIGLYLLQNLLVVRGDIQRHRAVGRIMGGLALWLVAVGFALLYASIAAHRAPPPIFTGAFLIVMDGINVLLFAALVLVGLRLRHRSDWHRRLMLSATVSIIAPALGRITVLAGGFSWPAIILTQIGLLAIVVAFDILHRGKPHPAVLWGAGAIALMGIVVPPLALLPGPVAVAQSIAGT
ncbi:MAG: hypothetical protein ACKOPM_14905 [Novosphingobium sp.]